ncbi:MFS transporter [Rhodococcus sp. BP-349]|nr:MFS transporter [Rhodococcus sp. BP-363]MBY6542474.1 MFS transporter [Rhodococcus sp. BP-369]MBY6561704.1 MFS transporter [Rhodococcus sp. BP-370]MBY6575996.1 MFS transporter [Rhodococcus sp. BP-364]MBY6585297.1 MFS transporter [Rhodococcus sp. BP-358]MBY6589634.1 MFS transporter [Rhodococcus sp. BP-362]MBY6593833.1 MFS transporter [Rhodococcus sp. BP-359]MBY6598310.1 MFS transporter [Rhodococcus sp. BP-353]MBY6602510.1 MFS transporter [Rhodococcus sp. BP-351]MBY6606846.1 MFS transporte
MGWALDGFAGSLYALVLGPAMTELLPNSGLTVDADHIGLYGGLTVALFLAGWATGGILFGVLADYFGRVRVLSIGIVTYAVFTALAAFADTWWQLGVLRFIAGLGSGVEAPVGAALVAEVWRNKYRARACGVMMSGYAGGFFIAALAYGLLGTHGWRFMLVLAVVPAFLVWFLRRYVPEPEEITTVIATRKERKRQSSTRPEDQFVLKRLLSPPHLRATLICTALATGSLLAFWSVSTWYPQIIRTMATAESLSADVANHRVAITSMLFNAGGIIGYATWGFLADAIGRRKAFMVSFVCSAVSIAYLFPFEHSYTTYLLVIPLVGFGLFGALSGNFVYGPEMFSPSMRASGIALANSIGRYITAAGPLVAGVIATSWFGGDLGTATAVLAATGVIALVGLWFAPETRGAALPTDTPTESAPEATSAPIMKGTSA